MKRFNADRFVFEQMRRFLDGGAGYSETVVSSSREQAERKYEKVKKLLKGEELKR